MADFSDAEIAERADFLSAAPTGFNKETGAMLRQLRAQLREADAVIYRWWAKRPEEIPPQYEQWEEEAIARHRALRTGKD